MSQREWRDDFVDRHPLPLYQLQAAERMRDCRTMAMGSHVIGCPQGHVHRIAYNSCRHRSCPQCSGLERERWLAGWNARLRDPRALDAWLNEITEGDWNVFIEGPPHGQSCPFD